MMQDIERFSGTRIGPGTLYTAITRLVEKGSIKPDRIQDRQRPYRITEEGITRLSAELGRMQTIAKFGLRRLRFS
jgi:DNA-binding PadR family transcriptional regulator